MHIPNGWTTAPAGGYGNLTRLTHDRCGRHQNVDIVLDEPGVRRFLARHECEDLREERVAREEREERDNEARQATGSELAELRTRVSELADELATVAAPVPVRLLVLDATTPDTLNASVDALASTDFLALTAAVDTAQHRECERTALAEIREVLTLSAEVIGGRTAIGVLFAAEGHVSVHYLAEQGTVLFDDGTTAPLVFDDIDETLRELYEDVESDSTLAVDLRTDTFNFVRRPRKPDTIHARFGVAEPGPSADDRILAIVRDTLAGDYEHDGDGDLAGRPIGVQFKSRQEEDGYFLSSDDGFVLFDGGDVAIVTFPGIAGVFAEVVGCVGSMYTLIVDLRGEGLVTRFENDLVPMTARFDLP